MGNNKQNSKMSKRWFVGASGWGISLEAGSGDNSNKTKRSTINSRPDTRILVSNGTVATAGFTHNTLITANPLYLISQGTADNQRIGDTIHLDTISLKLLFDTATATVGSAGVKCRVMLVACTAQYAVTAFTSGVGSTDMFYATSTNLVVTRLNPRLCKVLCDEIIDTKPTVSSVGALGYGHIECKVDAPFEFRTGSNYGTAANLYLVMVPYVVSGTSGTTTCGAFGYDYAVSYRDI
jgi:hypothetical protein